MRIWRFSLAIVVIFAGCSASGEDVRSLTILHTNDLHARLLPDDQGRGGFAEIATAIREERAKSDHVIEMNGGDLVQGTPVSSIFRGLPVYEIANKLGIDVSTLGNHEFDYGWQRVQEFVNTAEFPVVCANMQNGQGELLAGKAYVINEVGGIRLGIIGVVTADLAKITRAELRGPWEAKPVVETVRHFAREIQDQVDLVVLLSHVYDFEEDDVLQNVPEVNLIVSGHNHGGQDAVKQVDGRLCVKVRAYGRELGRLDLKVDVAGKRIVGHEWKKIAIEPGAFKPDPEVARLVAQWEDKVSEVVDVPIGTSRRRIARKDELKPLIEQIMRESVGADLAYMNEGGIRDGIPEGEIRARHVWNLEPFGNLIAFGRLKGSQLPREVSEGRRIDPEREYLVATNDFTAEKWAEQQGIHLDERGEEIRELMIAWIKKKKVIE